MRELAQSAFPGERETCVDALAVHEHGAAAALAVTAAVYGAAQMQLLAQRIEQAGPGFDVQRGWLALIVSVTGTVSGADAAFVWFELVW